MSGFNKSSPVHLLFDWLVGFFSSWNIQTCNPITYVVNKQPAVMFQMCDLETNHLTFPIFFLFFHFVMVGEDSIFSLTLSEKLPPRLHVCINKGIYFCRFYCMIKSRSISLRITQQTKIS